MTEFNEMRDRLCYTYTFNEKVNDVTISRASVLRQISGKRPTSSARKRFVDCVLELAEIAASDNQTFIDLDWLVSGAEHSLHDHGFRLQSLTNGMIRISW